MPGTWDPHAPALVGIGWPLPQRSVTAVGSLTDNALDWPWPAPGYMRPEVRPEHGPCGCLIRWADEPAAGPHTIAEHDATSCGGTAFPEPCGGCFDCMAATVARWDRLAREAAEDTGLSHWTWWEVCALEADRPLFTLPACADFLPRHVAQDGRPRAGRDWKACTRCTRPWAAHSQSSP